ncbi:unnamed protein product, partial [Scytosiphon promiscuus]
ATSTAASAAKGVTSQQQLRRHHTSGQKGDRSVLASPLREKQEGRAASRRNQEIGVAGRNGRQSGAGEETSPFGGSGGGGGSRMVAEGDDGGALWRDLVQKHLQRALEDPYHGVRAVACSCHACLLNSDWEAFSDRERDLCLGRVLAATRDRAAGVNILACRVIAGIMTMAGQEGAAAWSRDPDFLGRCAARLQEMMEDTKATIRAQAVLAVGNLSCSLHGIRSRRPSRFSRQPSSGDRQHTVTPSRDEGDHGSGGTNGTVATTGGVRGGGLVSRSRLRSLCSGALRLTATEPDHAAGSAVRALGYLAWGLDPDNAGDDGVCCGALRRSGKSLGGRNQGSSGGGGGELRSGGGRDDLSGLAAATASRREEGREGRGRASETSGGGSAAAPDDATAAGGESANERGEGSHDANGGGDGDNWSEEDRDLQDRTVLALSARLAPDEGDLALGAER